MSGSNLPKRILKSDAGLAFTVWFIANYLRIIEHSVSWRRDYHPDARKLIEGDDAFIACFWHGRMVMMSSAWRSKPKRMNLLVSTHRDGRMISGATDRLGYKIIEAESRRGGLAAFREMARALQDKQVVAITPDGPRGPRMRVKAGALKIAQLSGAPIVPITGSVARRWTLKSWDSFMIPKPFTRGVLMAGEPVFIPKDLSDDALEERRLSLEKTLLELSEAADREVGQEPITPQPPEA